MPTRSHAEPVALFPPPDPGIFGPDSVSWRVVADPVLGVGGLRALLLQALHPTAILAVSEHSGFRSDPWGRLRRTAEYVGVTTFGTTDEAHRAAARVRGVHRQVTGIDPIAGRPYRADDTDLLRWVHCTEAESFLTTVRRCGAAISDTDADRYYAEQADGVALLGLDRLDVPRSRAEMAAYFAEMRPELGLTAPARAAARFVFAPPMHGAAAIPGRPAWAALASLAFAMLPRWARRMYRMPGLPTTDLAVSLQGRALRAGLLAVPRSVREGPHVRAARERLAC
jgi:uncharacterized protein (DUF2236 family)